MSTNVWPSDREPYHGDIAQGRLGNCFLIASLQALASCQPQLLKSIISLSPLTCFFYRQGERIEIPVVLEPITNEYHYCRSTVPDVQWPYIIEQAYAQFYGGRLENLAGGNTSEALYDLLGKPVDEFEPSDNNIWEKIDKGLAEKNTLVTCGAVATNETIISKTANGLVKNHAYAILATFIYQQTREKYVLIHNPHGTNHIHKENNRARDVRNNLNITHFMSIFFFF
jgi:calpain-15